MKFDRSNKFDLCYYGQVNSLRIKSSVASKWASKHLLGGIIYFAGELYLYHFIDFKVTLILVLDVFCCLLYQLNPNLKSIAGNHFWWKNVSWI